MRVHYVKNILKTAVSVTLVLLLGASLAVAQQQVNLTAGLTSVTMPDGATVPMWGYTCGAAVSGSTATCARSNPGATGWSPVVITVPTGQGLTINLTNALTFTATTVPTSLVIVGQVGGGLGDAQQRTTGASPSHAQLSVTWPTVGAPGSFNPPVQVDRVRSFGTEVAAGTTTPLTWNLLRPGTYLMESGTHPSIQVPMGLYGMVVVTTPPTTTGTTPPLTETAAGTAYPGMSYDAEVPLLFSEMDPVQNTAVNTAVNTVGFSETTVWSGQPGGCGNPGSSTYHTCYPPAVNYTPLYYMINGIAFDKTHSSNSLIPVSDLIATPPSTGTPKGTVLVRMVNAGSKMHVPAIVGSLTGASATPGFALVAEDGNPIPGAPRVQSDVFMAAGKTYDVMINGVDKGPVTSIVELVTGAGYGGLTSISLSGGAGYGGLTSIPVANGGGGYDPNNPPVVTIAGNGTVPSTATANAVVDSTSGAVTTINLTNSGYGYTSAPVVTIAAPPATNGVGTAAQATAGTPTFGLAPNVTISGGGGTAAAISSVTVNPDGSISFTLANSGYGYTSAPTITIDPPQTMGFPGTQALATATFSPAPNIVITGDGTTVATAVATVLPSGALLITLQNGGAGYTFANVAIPAPVDIGFTGTSAVAMARIGSALPVYDRQLSLSGNATERDAGMLAYISINGAQFLNTDGALINSSSPVFFGTGVANPDTYNALVPGQTLTVSDSSKGVIANDVNVYGVQLSTQATNGTVTLNPNGTFTYVPSGTATSDSFGYCANGTTPTSVNSICTTVTLGPSALYATNGVTCSGSSFNSTISTYLAVKTPGVLANCKDGANLPITVATSTITASAGLTVIPDANGGFTATATGAGTYTFSFQAKNSQGVLSNDSTSTSATPVPATTVTLNFPAGSNLAVTVKDPSSGAIITDYRWVIEEDRTFYINPNCVTNPPPAGCPTGGIVPTLGTNFHTSYMPFVAQGCTGAKSCEVGQQAIDPVLGTHSTVVCDVSNGVCRPDTTGNGMTQVLPGQVHLDPTKRYYISVLPGDAADPFYGANTVGHGMGGAPIGIDPNTGLQQTSVTILTQPSPYPPSKLSVFVFEDDFPLNGEQDGGGGVDVLSPQEPGLGGFQIHLWDAMGGNGDFTGQMTYDMFNQPLSNSLDGTLDPATGLNACPITQVGSNTNGTPSGNGGITGMIVTCPKYEADGKTLSPLAGQAVIANLMPGRFGVIATPAADRIARGEEWLQTNTLDGQKAHDSFVRIGEPSFFQEFGPAGYHVSIGFANPAIINARHDAVCDGSDATITGSNCHNTLTGKVTGERLSRTPDERLYSSGSHDAFYWTQCFVSFGDPDGEDFAFTKCNADGTFTLNNLPDGDWRVTTFDQWNDQLVDGLSTPVRLKGGVVTNLGDIASTQWQTNLYTRTFIDDNKDGISTSDEAGIPLANVAVRLRDGSLENLLVTDPTGTANFNETFPLFSWYTVETDTTRYKNTGTHVVYDVGGPADGTLSTCGGTVSGTGYPPCGTSTIGKNLANTVEVVSVPTTLRVPGAVYCAGADCSGKSIQNGPGSSDPPSNCSTSSTGVTTCSTILSSGRIDPPWFGVEGWQGFPGQNSFLEFGKEPYIAGENGGIKGHVIYASTRPFDDPQMLVQTQWEPLVPHVMINLYQEGFAADNVTPTLTLVDTTQTSSFDDWAQGFHLAADGVTKIPNMNCPGQGAASGPIPDLFFFSLYNQPNYLDFYNNVQHGTAMNPTALPNNSQFKCYDGMHDWNQLQPAPYDGMYQFPSVTSLDPTTGKPNGTNCQICKPNTVVPSTDLYYGLPMLPTGKYVVEVVVPPGFELVKEEDKNILIGDNFIAPVTQEFGGLGNIFILPDQAQVSSAYNANNAQNPTQSFGASPNNGIVPAFIPEPTWPCVGEARVVPDYISLYPQSQQVAPFAGATRNLCDRKEVTLGDQMGAIAKFYIYTSTHIASKFTGGITDDYTSEFDPFSPQFGEKFAPPDLPVSVKDWTGAEISRVYADHWGSYDGMTYSTWEVNPPNPTGYSPTMMVFCMNDPGPILDTRVGSATNGQLITDPLFTQGYSQFCYELPFMPGTTQYLDTPVVPTSAFAGAGYNNVDCAYPDATPAIAEVDGDGVGPWVSATGPKVITIHALGDQQVPNYAYSGPSATKVPFSTKTINRHYGFGPAPTPNCNFGSSSPAACPSVTVGGIPLHGVSWSDTTITGTVQGNVPACAIQQQAQYGGSNALCGQLVITAANGKQTVDTVTVTIGGKAPTRIVGNAPMTQYGPGAIQQAIDAAQPGDLIIVPPGNYYEMVLMWKPVRLQGVGAATSVINASTHPAGKMDTWRKQVNCLFGLTLSGAPNGGDTGCAGTKWKDFTPTAINPQVDRLPLEATLGWDASLNGNMAELLQEPSLMGALEGAGITVLAKGVNFPSNPYDPTLLAGFPANTALFTAANTSTYCDGTFPSNFTCNPSSIDGLGITQSSQGGGAIFVHGWGHNLQIANNRIANNAGTLSGGINVGQGEFPPSYIQGSATNVAPGSCETSATNNVQLPYCHNVNVNVHNNYVSLNSSTGDELFSATPAGAGGVSFCTGSDYYKFNYNWVCGNLSSGDGGGLGHLGFIKNGDIEHNSILFNQSLNPTIPANGGGILIMGTPDADPTCGATTDADCVPTPSSIGPSDGMGPGLVINANLIMGNGAESGSGGGLRFQNVNGSEMVAFPNNPGQWYMAKVTNNIIANNVAGWDGAGISLEDAFKVDIINNTIISNVSTASAGVLFNTIGGPLASSSGPTCTANCGTTSAPQPSGLVSIQNSAVLTANLPASITCPPLYNPPGASTINGACRSFSYPRLHNNVFWQNSSYYIGVGALSPAFQQNVISLYNAFTSSLAGNQLTTGACTTASYWDLGVRGDTGPNDHTGSGGVLLNPRWSILSPGVTGYAANNMTINPEAQHQYCNGSRQPPEACDPTGTNGCGWAVPPGISDATVPNPIFNLTPVATVDEGNNWVNMRWGPLSLVNPVTNAVLGNYSLAPTSAAIDHIPVPDADAVGFPTVDFFGNPRPDPSNLNSFDIGAVEYQGNPTPVPPVLTSISPNSGLRGTVVPVTLTGSGLTEVTTVTVAGGITVSNVVVVSDTSITATFTIPAATTVGGHNVSVRTPTLNSNTIPFTVQGPTLTSINPTSGVRGTNNVAVTLTGTNLTGATAVTVSGTGVTVSGVTAVNSTTVTATFAIASTAGLTARNVAVVTPAGTSNNVTFTVQGPTLTSVNPTSGVRGTNNVAVTLTGTNLTGATAVTVAGTGVTCPITGTPTATTVTASCTITASAGVGAHNVTVTTPIGTTNSVTFTVTGATVAFSGPSPALTTGGPNATATRTGLETVSNTATGANAGPFTMTASPSIGKVGTAGGTFSIIAGGTCTSTTVLAAGASCTINVQYVPGGSTVTATAHVTVTGTGLATATATSANFSAN